MRRGPYNEAVTSPRVIGRYALYGKIASGGMATVHFGRLAGPAGFSRTVAIKRMHAHFAEDPEFVSMFLDEARLAGRVTHPNVVQTLDVVSIGGELFLVMEYVQGETLARLVHVASQRGQLVPISIAAALVSGVLRGLHAAHEAHDEHGNPLEIVHRDVSPQNVLVGVDGVPRLLDFGVAKAVGRLQTTRAGQIKGKLAYMAPEQARHGTISRRSDVYSASVVLWEILAGRRLFAGEDDAMTLHAVLQGVVLPPSHFVRDVPRELDAVVLRGLAADPGARFATAKDMAEAIEAIVPMAIAPTVGAWVEATATEAIANQVARIAEIESAPHALPTSVSSTRAAVSPDASEAPTVLSQPSALSVVASTRPPHPDARRLPFAGVALGSAALAIAVGVVAALLVARQTAPTAAAPVQVTAQQQMPAPAPSDTWSPAGTTTAVAAPSSSVTIVVPATALPPAPPAAATALAGMRHGPRPVVRPTPVAPEATPAPTPTTPPASSGSVVFRNPG